MTITLQDLPLFWQGRANALRILNKKRKHSDIVTLETARIYEECATEIRASLETFKARLAYRLNDHLCGMKEGYDDSIVGFNEAWDIMRKLFEEAP